MRCRKHNRKITIETPTRANNSYGEPIETFSTYAIRWAGIDTEKGAEKFNGYQEHNEYTILFTVRYDDVTKNITEKMRISFNSKYYDIESIVNYNELNKEIHLYGKNRGS